MLAVLSVVPPPCVQAVIFGAVRENRAIGMRDHLDPAAAINERLSVLEGKLSGMLGKKPPQPTEEVPSAANEPSASPAAAKEAAEQEVEEEEEEKEEEEIAARPIKEAAASPVAAGDSSLGFYDFHDEAASFGGIHMFGQGATEIHKRRIVRANYCTDVGGHESFTYLPEPDGSKEADKKEAVRTIQELCPSEHDRKPPAMKDGKRYIAVVMRGETFRGHYRTGKKTGNKDSGTCGNSPLDKAAIRQTQRYCTKSVEELVFALESDGYDVHVFGATYECTNGDTNPFLTNDPPWYSQGGPPPLPGYIKR